MCNPARCIQAHGQGANQRGQVRLKAREFGRTDLPLPLVAQLVEDRFTLSQHFEAECGDLKAFATGVKGSVSRATYPRSCSTAMVFAAACLETDRRRPSSEALSAPAVMARMAKSWTGRTSS